MLKYLWKDIMSVLRFLPYGIIVGLVVALFLDRVNVGRGKKGKTLLPVAGAVCFFMYVAILLIITFFSRENGSVSGMDLNLFSTWGINDRNNAYVIENVLLFIPFGMVFPWYLKRVRSFVVCTALGLFSSFGIELLQLLTRRGFFQIDDILTNVLGSIIGYLIFGAVRLLGSKIRPHGA